MIVAQRTGFDGKKENPMNDFLLMTRQVKSGKQKPRKGVHMSQHYLCSRGNDEDDIPGYHGQIMA